MTTIWHFHFWVNYPFNIKVFVQFCLVQCDEWGRAESRGNGARPVELMMMSDILKLLLNNFGIIQFFKCSPVPTSFFPFYKLCYIGAETREEGGGNRRTFKEFNNTNTKVKRQPLTDDCRTQNTN